jgi:acyl-CoA thioester hydrolase
VRTRISQVRSRLIRFEYEVLDTETGQCLVTGFTTHVCLDRQGRPTRIPEEWRQFWSGFVAKAKER